VKYRSPNAGLFNDAEMTREDCEYLHFDCAPVRAQGEGPAHTRPVVYPEDYLHDPLAREPRE